MVRARLRYLEVACEAIRNQPKGRGEGVSQKKTESNNSGGFWVVMAVLGWGVWLVLVEWWEANWVVALERLRVAGIAVFGLGVAVLAVRWRWKRRRSVSVGVRTVGDGWPPGARSVVALVPSVEGPRGPA